MPISFDRVYINAASYYLPGKAISNDEMDAFIAPINRLSNRIKAKILADNGIRFRHYAIDENGDTVESHVDLACQAIKRCIAKGNTSLTYIDALCVGSSGSDALMPGFANMIQGALGAPPTETLSSLGGCQRYQLRRPEYRIGWS